MEDKLDNGFIKNNFESPQYGESTFSDSGHVIYRNDRMRQDLTILRSLNDRLIQYGSYLTLWTYLRSVCFKSYESYVFSSDVRYYTPYNIRYLYTEDLANRNQPLFKMKNEQWKLLKMSLWNGSKGMDKPQWTPDHPSILIRNLSLSQNDIVHIDYII